MAEVQIKGLQELRRDLRSISRDAPKALSRAHKGIASFVASRAKVRARGLSGRFPSYRNVIPKIRPRGSQRKASVVMLGPLANAAEFGAHVHPVFGRFRSQASFRRRVWPAHAGQQGYVIFPTERETRDEVAEMYLEALDKVLRRHWRD